MEEFERYPSNFNDENALRLRSLTRCRIQNYGFEEIMNKSTSIEA
jgi:hypothetical protein